MDLANRVLGRNRFYNHHEHRGHNLGNCRTKEKIAKSFSTQKISPPNRDILHKNTPPGVLLL